MLVYDANEISSDESTLTMLANLFDRMPKQMHRCSTKRPSKCGWQVTTDSTTLSGLYLLLTCLATVGIGAIEGTIDHQRYPPGMADNLAQFRVVVKDHQVSQPHAQLFTGFWPHAIRLRGGYDSPFTSNKKKTLSRHEPSEAILQRRHRNVHFKNRIKREKR